MSREDRNLRLPVLFFALSLGIALTVLIHKGYFRSPAPREPTTFRIRLEEAHRSPAPYDIAVRMEIRPDGAFSVDRASGCGIEMHLESDDWTAACASRQVRDGRMSAADVSMLREKIRSMGFYRWRSGYRNPFGNTDAARICVTEAGKDRCVQVRSSIYFSESGPYPFWATRREIYMLVGEQPRWGKAEAKQ